jgi:hypothetical protein
MKTARRILTVALGALALVVLAPILFQLLSAGAMRGYFKDGRCMCGYESFIHITGGTYYSDNTQHGMGVDLVGLVQREGDKWVLRLQPKPELTNYGVMVITGPGGNPRLRIQGGDLYAAWGNNTDWKRHPRVYNPWRIWLARLFAKRAVQITCVNNLKQVGLAFRQWALDNADQFPFNVSTNAGGTRELCDRGTDGFERNAACHLLVMSNELNTPKILVCPKDKRRQPGVSFTGLEAAQVTYRLRSGTNLNEANPQETLMVCPIDGNTLYFDGSVQEGKK